MSSNNCYIIQEREFLNLNQDIYKIGKTTQEGLKRTNQYPKGSKIILFMEVQNCHEFENKVKNLFDKKYIHRKDIGSEYYEGDKEQMIKDFIDIKNNLINFDESQPILKHKNQILVENQIYYYPQAELEKFYEILQLGIQKFNDINKSSIVYNYDRIHMFMNTYIKILNWYCNTDEEINIKKELINIKTKIEYDALEYNILTGVINFIFTLEIDIENINDNEKDNIIKNTILFYSYSHINFSSYHTQSFLQEQLEQLNLYDIKKYTNYSIENKYLLTIYNNIKKNKILDEIIRIKLIMLTPRIKNEDNTWDFLIIIDKLKKIIYSKYYSINKSYQHLTIDMLQNMEDYIKKIVNYELIYEEDKYIGIKYFDKINSGRFITNIKPIYNEIQENLEGWITNNVDNIYETDVQYLIGLKLKFKPLLLTGIINKIIEQTNLKPDKILDEFIKTNKYVKKIEEYNKPINTILYGRNTELDYDLEMDYNIDLDNDYINDLEQDSEVFCKCYYGIMKNLNNNIKQEKLFEILLKNNKNKITNKIVISEQYYLTLLNKKDKLLNKFLKHVEIINYCEHPIWISSEVKDNILTIPDPYKLYDMSNNNIINNNFNYVSDKGPTPIPHKKKIKNINEYEQIITELTNKESVKIFKKFCKSVLQKNKYIKCVINNANEYNLIDIFLWTLYHLDYTRIQIDLEKDKLNDFKNELKINKKVIVLFINNESEIKKAYKIIDEYSDCNIIVKNFTKKKINELEIIDNISFENKNLLVKQYIDDYENTSLNAKQISIYNLLDKELVMLLDWINNNHILNDVILKINKDQELVTSNNSDDDDKIAQLEKELFG